MKNKKILITGGCGSIGTMLVKQLQENNNIDIIDNFSSNNKIFHSQKKIRIYKINIANYYRLKKLLIKKNMIMSFILLLILLIKIQLTIL